MPTRIDNLFSQITDAGNIAIAHSNTQRGHLRYQGASLRFNQNLSWNLARLREQLIDGSYRCKGYYHFKVYEPKERLIWAPKYQDKIVQHAVNNILKDVYLPTYIRDSYACIEGRGSHRAVAQITADLRAAKRQHGTDAWIAKLDIRKFFYSINRDILKTLLRKRLRCAKTLALLDHIIDSSPEQAGLPLGNLTSQLFANIYLNELDQYAKRRLQQPWWVRYSDDITAVVGSKAAAQILVEQARQFLYQHLDLELHPRKTDIFPIRQGVNTLGFKIHATHCLLRDDSKRRIKRKVRAMPTLVASGALRAQTAQHMLGSWCGHAKHGCSRNFVRSLCRRNPHLAMRNGPRLRLILPSGAITHV